MKKIEFINRPIVVQFVEWLNEKYETIEVKLNIKNSPKVSSKIDLSLKGFNQVLTQYNWKSSWASPIDGKVYQSSNWVETRKSLLILSQILKKAVNEQNQEDLFNICKCVLRWGGDRNPKQGALPQITKLYHEHELVNYLDSARAIFDGNDLEYKKIENTIKYAGSMWTKIYAFNSKTGAPIYDSRVAAALATLVALFTYQEKKPELEDIIGFSVPQFSTQGTNNKQRAKIVLPDGKNIKFKKLDGKKNPIEWTICTLKLSWLIDALIQKNNNIFPSEVDILAKKHALEATLFMMGYDVKSIIK